MFRTSACESVLHLASVYDFQHSAPPAVQSSKHLAEIVISPGWYHDMVSQYYGLVVSDIRLTTNLYQHVELFPAPVLDSVLSKRSKPEVTVDNG
jgi:hypothetical protein